MDLGHIGERVEAIARNIVEKAGLEFVRSEIGGTKRSPIIRVFIDRREGLSIEHCAQVSREIEAVLDTEDLIPTKFVLEVSSPGLERELYSLEDFRRFTGKLVKVKTETGTDGHKTLIGRINGLEGNDIKLEIRSGDEVLIPFSSVLKANLKIELDEEFRQR